MSYDGEDDKIKELFHELRQADERHAPSFAIDWETARSRVGTVRWPRRVFQVAAATALLMMLVGFMVILLRPPTRPSVPTRASDMAISQWRSPTDFLLRSPTEPLLTTVPHLGDSLVEIKAILPDEKN